MDHKVKLVIELPDKVLKEKEAAGVIIPARRGDITILSQRAPSVFVTDYGMIQLLDDTGKAVQKIFVTAGMADMADGKLHLLTSRILESDEISAEEALKRSLEADNESDKLFYQMIGDRLKNKRLSYRF